VEMYRCGRGHGSNFVMISRRELRAVPPKPHERVIEGPKRKHGTLQLQPSGRWAVCRPGRRPVEIMSDEFGSRSAAKVEADPHGVPPFHWSAQGLRISRPARRILLR
jgi:hypothetical protein